MSVGRFGISTGAYFPEQRELAPLVVRARSEGWPYLELLAAMPDDVDRLVALTSTPHALDGFARVSIHAPVTAVDLALLPAGFETILHPHEYRDACALGDRAVFENMDVAKPSGRTVEDLAAVFDRHPRAGFCLDVAHVWTNDPTLALGHDLLDAFGERLRQLHVSGIEPDGTHRDTTSADLALYEPLLARCGHVPWILEARLI